MAAAKYKVLLTESPTLYGILKIDISLLKETIAVAEALGIGKQEQENILGQKLSEITQLLGNSDEV